MFDNKKILITGGTGSLGRALTKKLLESKVNTIRIYSRDELKQIKMQNEFDDGRLRFLIGDVREKERLAMALEDIDMVIHTAALKHVPIAEYNPFEAVKTNVYGSQNLIEACLEKNVKIALAIGTDKAVAPLNTYGATKLLMERLFIAANYYKGKHQTNFLCVRYGNVLGSRGSILPLFVDQIIHGKKISITDPKMTRFNITMEQALDLIFRTIKNGKGGEVFIPKLKAYKVGDMKDAITDLLNGNGETIKIPIRPGEKFHESLISKDEIRNVFETDKDYVILEEQIQEQISPKNRNLKKSILKEQYSSDKVELLKKNELKKILEQERLIPKTNK